MGVKLFSKSYISPIGMSNFLEEIYNTAGTLAEGLLKVFNSKEGALGGLDSVYINSDITWKANVFNDKFPTKFIFNVYPKMGEGSHGFVECFVQVTPYLMLKLEFREVEDNNNSEPNEVDDNNIEENEVDKEGENLNEPDGNGNQ